METSKFIILKTAPASERSATSFQLQYELRKIINEKLNTSDYFSDVNTSTESFEDF